MPVGYSIYVETPSPIHNKIDPRTKLAVLGTIFVMALEFNHPLILGILTLAVLAVGLYAQLSFKRFLPFFVGGSWFLILGVLIWPFYISQGLPLFKVFGAQITLDGLLFGLAMGLRVGLMVVAAGVWMMTTSPQKMTVGLLHLGLPYKAGVAMTAAIRFVPLLNAERATIAEAQQARALGLRHGNPFSRALKSVAIIGPLFIRAIDVAQGLALAMDARGFAARDSRTSIVELRLTRVDRVIMYSLL